MSNANHKPLDLSKPVQTRDGRPARIICTDLQGEEPIVAAIALDGRESAQAYYEQGRFLRDEEHDLDLVNVPPTKKVFERWINIYSNGESYSHDSADAAARRALGAKTKPTTIHIKHEYIEGENEA